MTDWKELARKHEESANEYARMNYKLETINADLLEALRLARDACAFLAECNADADPEDHERLAIVTEAISKAEEQSNAS